jgi:hypothetical protein
MLLSSVMKDGCNKSEMHGGMNNRRFNGMKEKAVTRKRKGHSLGGRKDWRRLQTTHPGRSWQFTRLSIFRKNMQLLSQLLITLYSTVRLFHKYSNHHLPLLEIGDKIMYYQGPEVFIRNQLKDIHSGK